MGLIRQIKDKLKNRLQRKHSIINIISEQAAMRQEAILINSNKKAELIAKKARKSISSYCYEECKSYCCRKGYLVMTQRQADLVTSGKTQEFLEKEKLKKLTNKMYSLDMEKEGMPCPALIDYKCTIHNKRNRPKACKEFPIFIEGNKIRLSARCPAVREGKLYPFVHKLVSTGYKLEKAHAYSGLELHRMNF